MEDRQDGDRIAYRADGPGAQESYAFTVELWNLPGSRPERVLARAANLVLARAVFAAAQTEYPGRRLVLRQGDKVVAESG